ncbi:TolC family protein [Photobacterium rosenbergii]|uniref:TolC family protein n=1 Tax=Photobacterium rosenbergii TaxID=294936 RepID=A0ABU3ZIC1_9GAMM|nr:TolC family protein [Photobacterium rosenbergii]MDV5169648.1 TolC family protein [Photobacterium rosenbergii]
MKIKLCTLLVGALSCGANASQFASTDLQNLYDLALKNDSLLNIAVLSEKQSEYAIDAQKGQLLPQINAYFNASAFFDSDEIQATHGGSGSLTEGGISLRQAIYTPAVRAGVAIADKNSESASLLVTKAHEALIFRTTNAYFEVLRTKSLLDNAKANEKALIENLEITQRRSQAGISSEIDLLQAQARRDQSAVAVIQAQTAHQLSLDALQTITGHEFSSVQPLKTVGFTPNLPVSETGSSWLDAAMVNNRDIQLAGIAIEKSRLEVNRAKAGHKPQLSLIGRVNQRLHGDLTENVTGGQISADESLTSAEVVLAMNVPLYTGSSLSALVDIANTELDIAYQVQEESHRQTYQNVRYAIRHAEATEMQIDAFEKTVVSQRKALESVQRGYELGARNMSEVLDATRDYYVSESQLNNAYFSFIEAALLIKFLAGEISESDITALNASIEPITQ